MCKPNRKNSPQRRRGRGVRRDFLFLGMQHPTSDTLRPLRLGGEFFDRFGEDLICKGLKPVPQTKDVWLRLGRRTYEMVYLGFLKTQRIVVQIFDYLNCALYLCKGFLRVRANQTLTL